MNISSTIQSAFKPTITERDPERRKVTTGMENVLKNTTGDNVEPDATFVVFKNQAVEGKDKEGNPVLQVADLIQDEEGQLLRKGWIPKDAFEDIGEAYYLPTYRYSSNSALIGGVSRGLISAGVPGAVAGAIGGVAAGRLGDSAVKKFAVGALAGTAALTALQVAVHGTVGIPSALFAGSVTGLVAAASGSGDASVRDSMLGGTAAGLAATLATGLPMGVLTGSAATAIGAKVENRAGQVLLSAGIGAALTTAQALISGNSVPLAAGLGAAIGGAGSLIGPSLGQASRNLQAAVEPSVAKVVGKMLEGRGETSFQVASAVPQALAFGGLGASLGIVAPGLGPVGAAIGATIGGVTAYHRAGNRIEELKKLQEKRMAAHSENAGAKQ